MRLLKSPPCNQLQPGKTQTRSDKSPLLGDNRRTIIEDVPLGTFDPSEPIDWIFEFDNESGTASTLINGVTAQAANLFVGANEKWGSGIINQAGVAATESASLHYDGESGNGVLVDKCQITGLGTPLPIIGEAGTNFTNFEKYVEVPIEIPTGGIWQVQHSSDLIHWKTISGSYTNSENTPYSVFSGIEYNQQGWYKVIPFDQIDE